MKHSIWNLNEYLESQACAASWREGDRPDLRHRQMLSVMRQALPRELTHRQRQCVQLYYYEGKNINQIAELLQVCPSTVCRHLQKARSRLSSILGYCFPSAPEPLSRFKKS